MYCNKCGVQQNDDAVFCSKCGNKLKEDQDNNAYQQNTDKVPLYTTYNPSRPPVSHIGLTTGEKFLICFGNTCISPLLGIVLYFVWKSNEPKKSDDVCMVTIWSAVLWVVLMLLFVFVGIMSEL